jgi:hypothetical protein
VQTENNITASKLFDYARQLYEQDAKVDPPPLVNIDTELFTMQEVEMGIKRLGAGKAKDLDELQVEYLKWGLKILSPHITKIFNNIIQQGFPQIGQLVWQYLFSRVVTSIIPPIIEP